MNDNERRLSRLLSYHVPPMCNAKLLGTHTRHWADPPTHTTNWADPKTYTAICYDRVVVWGVGLNQKQYIIKGIAGGMGFHLVYNKIRYLFISKSNNMYYPCLYNKWTSLGFYKNICISMCWQFYQMDFRCRQRLPHTGCIVFISHWLGTIFYKNP